MRIRKCDYVTCDDTCETETDVAIALCQRHENKLSNENNYAVICWDCGTIALIEKRPDYLTERYLFVEGCSRCKKERTSKGNWTSFKGTIGSSPTDKPLLVNQVLNMGAVFQNRKPATTIEPGTLEWVGKPIILGDPYIDTEPID